MDEAAIDDPEGTLLNFIRQLGELEWRKYQRRSVKKLIDGETRIEDQSNRPPFVSFRFKHESEATIQRLGAVVASFSGNVRWGLFGHQREGLPGVNWLICPEEVQAARVTAMSHGLSVGAFIAEVEPTFAELAYKDLVGLELALRTEFGI
ncbi:hypothetical protein [Dyella sp. C9]|uniref:hypothetical protein n=1 Tax=Dyella sp. C9 TaxID=2202154 RepID=UPI000DEEEC32|nr:hypothetical protein [Dyella sp. C9]